MNALEYISIIISIVGVLTSVGILLVWFGSFKQKVSQTDIDTKDIGIKIKDKDGYRYIETIENNQEEIPPLKQKLSQNNKDLDTLKTNIQTIVKDIHTIKTFLKRDKRRDTWKRET